MYHNIIIIPALNPPETLTDYVKKLIDHGFSKILLVDDGSSKEKQDLFEQLRLMPQVTVLRHGINLGKGRALKNAFNHALTEMMDDENCRGVITADSDGQHTVEDVIRLSNALDAAKQPTLFLGVRDFSGKDVPIKSSFGNHMTSLVFWMLYGKKITDTQTGLRAISREYIPHYLDLFGERFEYETNMLIHAVRQSQNMEQIPIQTVYLDHNSETHFKPLRDSFRIYRILLTGFFKFILSSGICAVIDLGLFYIFSLLLSDAQEAFMITAATIGARVLSSLCNFLINRNAVFQSKGKMGWQMVQYYLLAAVQMLASAGFVVLLHHLFHGTELIEKIIVDFILFLISYQIQQKLIFKENKKK